MLVFLPIGTHAVCMAHVEKTNQRDNLPSLWQRCLGHNLYLVDGDEMGFSLGKIEEVFMGFDGRFELRYVIDYKHIKLAEVEKQYFSDDLFTMKAPATYYDRGTKVPVPFFTVLTYLSDEFLDKMYFVLPTNNAAKLYFKKYGKNPNGHWMTPLRFSQFQHTLRDLSRNGEEVIDPQNLMAVGLPVNMKLNQLPNKEIHYPLPKLNFNPELVQYATQE